MIHKMVLASAIGSIGLFTASTAAAQKLEYDCDTQAEHFSVLKAVQEGPSYAAGGSISLREIFAVKDYVTLGMLQFEPDDRSWRARVGIIALKVGKDTVMMGNLEITRNGKAEAPKMIGEILEYQKGKTYPIRLSLGVDGGSATLGTHTVPVSLQAKGKVNVSVICSGGEFLFTDLNLGG